MRKNDYQRFSKRNVHKRKKKEESKAALLAIVKECGFSADNVKVGGRLDRGRGGRVSPKKRADETVSEGVFSSSKSGFGFVSVEGVERDIFIPEDKTLGAIDGDLVEIIYHEYTDRFGEARTEGRVRAILQYGRKTLVGELSEERIRHGRRTLIRRYLLPDDTRISLRPEIGEDMGARVGEKVEALIKRSSGYPECDVIRVFGEAESKEANYEAILAEEGISVDFSPEELSDAEKRSKEPISLLGRVDKREEIIFTIDGEGAKDLDDAVSIERVGDGYKLGVHIADVSHYVKEKTALDRAVMARGTSVYFVDKVVPMLPRSLSNGACSLNAGEDKYTLSATVEVNSVGEMIGVKIEQTVIRSRVRGVYSEVNRILSGEGGELLEKYREVLSELEIMRELYEKLREKSENRGALDFDAPEAEILLGEDGLPKEIVTRERGTAERIIEQFMILANEAVATYLFDREIPCVYRIHEQPPEDKMSDFVDYVHNLGFDTTVITRSSVNAKTLSRLLSLSEERGLLMPVSNTMLRAMSKARYSEERKPHFGLSLESYCHFTSPIRRLSDLATHRIIKKVLFEEKNPKYYSSYAKRAAAAATEAELRALSAERRIENLYKVIYMMEKVGEKFVGTVTSVTSFGMFVTLDNTVEGLVPVSDLPGVFIFNEKTLSLVSSKESFSIGERVEVSLEEADIIRGKLRFSLLRRESEE